MLTYLKSLRTEIEAIVAGLKEAIALTQLLIDLQKQLVDPVAGIGAKLDS
jgi:hypothetical protein